MQDILTDLSDDTQVLYEFVDKGFEYSIDGKLSKSIEQLLASSLPDSPPVPFSAKEMVRKLFASEDFNMAFDESAREGLVRSLPFLKLTYGQAIAMYRPSFMAMYQNLRGTDIAGKLANLVLALQTIETLDTVEIQGLAGFNVMMSGSDAAGVFEFLGKFLKDAGLVEALS